MKISARTLFYFLVVVFFCNPLISCKSKASNGLTEQGTTVIIKLAENATTEALEIAFKPYHLKKEKVLSRPLYIFLFTFDTNTTNDKDLVTLLKKSPLVDEAQLNRNVELRN